MRKPASTVPRLTGVAGRLGVAVFLLFACGVQHGAPGPASNTRATPVAGGREADGFTSDFGLERCSFASEGRNAFFNLTPGYTLLLAGEEDGDSLVLRITVLDETKQVGGITTRVVEERETENGETVEVSRNYFAICTQHNSVMYFGEDVDMYKRGKIVSHDGAWLHGKGGAEAGLMMPGLPLLRARYYQERAPRVALDRAEIVRLDATTETPLRRFTNVLVTEETTPLEPGVREYKSYAPDVGLIQDGDLLLVRAGFSVDSN